MAKSGNRNSVRQSKQCCDQSFVTTMIHLGLLNAGVNPNLKYLLCEDSAFLTLESGFKIKLEQSI